MGTAGWCYKGWERSALPLAALTALLLIDVWKVSRSSFSRLKILVHIREDGTAAPSHQGSGNPKEGSRPSCCCFPEPAVLGRAGIPGLLLPHYCLIPLLHLEVASPEPTLFPRGLYLNRGLRLPGKCKEYQRHFLCSVLKGSEMEPLPALGTRPSHSPRARPLWDRRSGP